MQTRSALPQSVDIAESCSGELAFAGPRYRRAVLDQVPLKFRPPTTDGLIGEPPSGAGNSLQNQSSTITYAFTGTQRAATNK